MDLEPVHLVLQLLFLKSVSSLVPPWLVEPIVKSWVAR
jgi:hypothetical protein